MLLGTTVGNCMCARQCVCLNVCMCVSKQSAVTQSKTRSLFSGHQVTRPRPALVIPTRFNAHNSDGGSRGSSEAHSPSPLHTTPLPKRCKALCKWSCLKWHRHWTSRSPCRTRACSHRNRLGNAFVWDRAVPSLTTCEV